MERLKPLDLERLRLRRTFRGYDRKATDEVLARATKEIELLLREVAEARESATQAIAELDRFRLQEATLRDTLLMAQRAADETRANAHREAELIVEAAHRESLDVRQASQGSINDLRWELERLRIDKQKFITQFKSMLEEQLRALDEGRSAQLALIEMEPQPELHCEEGVG